jgi:pSer/pThr/pTyr-binding forkhead associated (FHA) protein
MQVVVGRLPASSLHIADQEISGRHAVLSYDVCDERWRVTDVGSLNGSTLNGTAIGTSDRRAGQPHALSEGDVLGLGEVTQIRVSTGPLVMHSKRRSQAAGDKRGMEGHSQNYLSNCFPFMIRPNSNMGSW